MVRSERFAVVAVTTGWGRDRLAVLAQAVDVQDDRLADEAFHLVDRAGRNADTRQFGRVGSVTGHAPLDDHRVTGHVIIPSDPPANGVGDRGRSAAVGGDHGAGAAGSGAGGSVFTAAAAAGGGATGGADDRDPATALDLRAGPRGRAAGRGRLRLAGADQRERGRGAARAHGGAWSSGGRAGGDAGGGDRPGDGGGAAGVGRPPEPGAPGRDHGGARRGVPGWLG